jgi:hypothetical protein
LFIKPFSLNECEAFYRYRKIVMDRRQIVESYMILGGIPYYMNLINRTLSFSQNVDALFFHESGDLQEEFLKLYQSLFKHSEHCIKIVEALGKKAKGLTRDEIVAISKLSDGGTLSKMMEELELCGFIRRYKAFDKKNKYQLYQLVDAYTLFYLHFIRNNKRDDKHFWSNILGQAQHRAWSGYAFEQVCLSHIDQIKHKLGISGILTGVASWRSRESDPGAQVDLLIDRNDRMINLCEIKYAVGEFVIDKKYDENLRNKRASFIRETKTRKAVHLTMITTFGVKRNEYWGNIQSEVAMEDLFG